MHVKSRDDNKSSELQTCLWVHADPTTEEEIPVFTQNDNGPNRQLSRPAQGSRATDPRITAPGPLIRFDQTPKRRSGVRGVKCEDRWERSNCEELSELWGGGGQTIWPPSGGGHQTNKKDPIFMAICAHIGLISAHIGCSQNS